jgi:hypothetical protein
MQSRMHLSSSSLEYDHLMSPYVFSFIFILNMKCCLIRSDDFDVMMTQESLQAPSLFLFRNAAGSHMSTGKGVS